MLSWIKINKRGEGGFRYECHGVHFYQKKIIRGDVYSGLETIQCIGNMHCNANSFRPGLDAVLFMRQT